MIKEGTYSAEKIDKPDGFLTEKNILNELLKACTKEETKEIIEKHRKCDK